MCVYACVHFVGYMFLGFVLTMYFYLFSVYVSVCLCTSVNMYVLRMPPNGYANMLRLRSGAGIYVSICVSIVCTCIFEFC